MITLTGKIALVTGAARGIGRGIAEVFAETGADVAINDIDGGPAAEAVAASVRAKGRRAVAIAADVARRDQVEPMVEQVWSALGPIDILVNNAGIETIVPFLELTDEQWTRLVDTNLRGAWLCSQVYCRRVLAEGRRGAILNIGSIQAAKVLPGRTHYAPAKLGLEALTRNMSAEMTPQGIRVNCIHPGLIDTDMTAWVMKDAALLPVVLAQISMGRAGHPREIGTVAAFLASDAASYVTGQSLFVDGGWEGKIARKDRASTMRADWTPEAEARVREIYPRMVPCPLPDVHSTVEILGRRCTATDLTNDISPDNPTFKGHQRTVMWQHLTHEDVQQFGLTKAPYSYEVVAFTVCGHTSTHCDSISHIVPEPGARPIDKTPLAWHLAPGVWLDFAHKPPNAYITRDDIVAQLAAERLSLTPGSVFLYHTGWYRKFDTAPFEYIRDYPGLDGAAAHWLADQGVICVGADAPSVDSFYEIATRMVQPVHMMCRERGVLNVENLRNVDRIPRRAFTFIGLPLKVRNGCGSPIRAVALTED